MAAQTYFMQLRAVVDSLVKCIVSRGLLRGTAGRGSQERMIDAIEASKPIGLQIVFWRCAQRSRLLARIFQASGRLKPSPQCPASSAVTIPSAIISRHVFANLMRRSAASLVPFGGVSGE